MVPRLQLVRAPCLKFNSRLAHKWVMGIMPVEFTSNVIREPLLFRIRSEYFPKRNRIPSSVPSCNKVSVTGSSGWRFNRLFGRAENPAENPAEKSAQISVQSQFNRRSEIGPKISSSYMYPFQNGISAGFSAGFSARPKSLLNRHPEQ